MNIMQTATMKQGDTLPALRIQALDAASGVPLDLTEADTVEFHMRKKGETATLVSSPAAVVGDVTQGVLEYAWGAGDTDEDGMFEVEFQVTFSDGSILTVPNDRNILVKIVPEVG